MGRIGGTDRPKQGRARRARARSSGWLDSKFSTLVDGVNQTTVAAARSEGPESPLEEEPCFRLHPDAARLLTARWDATASLLRQLGRDRSVPRTQKQKAERRRELSTALAPLIGAHDELLLWRIPREPQPSSLPTSTPSVGPGTVWIAVAEQRRSQATLRPGRWLLSRLSSLGAIVSPDDPCQRVALTVAQIVESATAGGTTLDAHEVYRVLRRFRECSHCHRRFDDRFLWRYAHKRAYCSNDDCRRAGARNRARLNMRALRARKAKERARASARLDDPREQRAELKRLEKKGVPLSEAYARIDRTITRREAALRGYGRAQPPR